MAHKLKHFFQYQEEKQQRSESWDESGSSQQPHDELDPAELTYYEHKSKLRKTQVAPRVAGEEWAEEEVEEQRAGQKYSRAQRDRPGQSSENLFRYMFCSSVTVHKNHILVRFFGGFGLVRTNRKKYYFQYVFIIKIQ